MVLIAIPVGLLVIIGACALVMALYASRALFEPLLLALATSVPVIGSALANGAGRILDSVESHASEWGDDAVTPLARLIAAVPVHLSQVMQLIIDVLTALIVLAIEARQVAGSAASGAVTGTITGALDALKSRVDVLANLAVPQLANSINYVGAEGLRMWNQLRDETAASIDGLRNEIDQRVGAAVAGIEAGVIARIDALGAMVRGIEAGIIDRTLLFLNALRAEIMALIGALDGRVRGVEGRLDTDIPRIAVQVGALAGTVAAVETLARTTAGTLAKEITECIDPLCDNIKPEIPNIKAMIGILELGLLAGMVADAIVDPRGAARRTDAMVQGPVQSALNALFDPMG